MNKVVLVLGATGRFGRHACAQFRASGWEVREFDRQTDDLREKATGAGVIVNAWNPPYPEWEKSLPALHAQVISVAEATGATVVIPGNVYVFGKDTPAPWSENTPHRATNPLGRARIAMEEAYRQSGVRTIILRSGDFLDTAASGNWFDLTMTAKLAKGIFTYPGDATAPHAWSFLPDICRAAVSLAEMADDLPRFCDVPFPGYTVTGQEILETLCSLMERQVQLKKMSWGPFHLAPPFWPMGRHLLEMRYLWNTPHSLEGSRFEGLLPDFKMTPFRDAIAAAIRPLDVMSPGVGTAKGMARTAEAG